jgi:hypothetical protein
VSGGLVWGKKCAAVLLGRTAHDLQEPCAEVAPRAAGSSCAPGMGRPYVCERRSMCGGVHRTRIREVFGGGPVECMGAVYSRADRKLSTLRCRESAWVRVCARGQRDIDTDTI